MSTAVHEATYKALPPEGRALIDEGLLDAALPADGWLDLFEPLEDMDLAVETDLQRHGTRASYGCGFAIAIAFFGFIISMVLVGVSGAAAGAAGLVTVVLAGIFVIQWVRAMRRKKAVRRYDIDDAVRNTLRPLMEVLREDVKTGAPVRLLIDIRPLERPEACVHEGPGELFGTWRKLTVSYFDRRLFYLEAQMADGTQLRITNWERLRKRSGTKRGSSGKTKSKTKYAKYMGIDAIVRMPNDHYALHPIGPARADSGAKVAVRPGAKRSTVRVRHKVKGSREATMHAGEIMRAIAFGYRQARPARGGRG